VEEAVENGGGQCRIAEEGFPVIQDAIGRDQRAAAQLVSLMQQGLKHVGRRKRQQPGQEQIIEHQQIRLDEGLHCRAPFCCRGHRQPVEQFIRLPVRHAQALANRRIGNRLRHMTLPGTRWPDQERAVALGNELQRMQLKADPLRNLRVVAPVELRQRHALIQARCSIAALQQARLPPVQFILQDRREGFQETQICCLRFQNARLQRSADA